MHCYQVSAPYNPSRTSWPECAQYNWRWGEHELVLFWREPSDRDISAVAEAPLELGLIRTETIVWLLYRIQGACGWSDAAYSIHRVAAEERAPPPETSPTERALLHVILVDADTGIIRALRAASMSPELTTALHAAIRDQIAKPYDADTHDAEIAETYRRFPSSDLMADAATIREVAGVI